MATKELIINTFKENIDDTDIVIIIQEKLNEWGNDLETLRDVYDFVFDQCDEREKHFTMKNLFQYGDEITIEYTIENLLRMMARGS